MCKVKVWISAARLRTLPLSVSGIIVGASLGNYDALNKQLFHDCTECPPVWRASLFWLAILTTIGFQVLSNFANDYGDGIKGTDDNREGEKRWVASGMIAPKQMKRAMIITTVITITFALLLICKAFGNDNFLLSAVFFGLGLASIIAAVKYTIGKNAYGYSGLGDVFVFLFFGLLSVLGSYFLFTQYLYWELLLPAITIGFLSMAVLNLNNMRDVENDAIHHKKTLVVKLGSIKAKTYHYLLLIIAMLSALTFTFLNYESPKQYLYVIAFIPLLLNIRTVYKNNEPKLLDSELKKVALSTFVFAILFGLYN